MHNKANVFYQIIEFLQLASIGVYQCGDWWTLVFLACGCVVFYGWYHQ